MKNTLIIVVGPTGIGKSDVSLKIAQHYQTEIISADSRQIFKELCIGTAVPPAEDLQQAKHHFIQNISVTETYNASRFETEVLSLLNNLFPEKNPLIMTGGSMLYVDALCKGIDDIPDVDPEIRLALVEEFEANGIDALRLQLKKLDPEYYNQVDLKNPKRILHALEICLVTGKPYSSLRTNTVKKRPFDMIKIGLNMDREQLYDRINRRVLKMVEAGLFEEAASVFSLRKLQALDTVGYKEIFSYMEGEISKEEAIALIQRNTRRYARKQLTWFRKDPAIQWFEPHQEQEIIQYLDQKLER